MSNDMPIEAWLWEHRDNDYANGSGYYENGWLNSEASWATKYFRADSLEALQAENARLRECINIAIAYAAVALDKKDFPFTQNRIKQDIKLFEQALSPAPTIEKNTTCPKCGGVAEPIHLHNVRENNGGIIMTELEEAIVWLQARCDEAAFRDGMYYSTIEAVLEAARKYAEIQKLAPEIAALVEVGTKLSHNVFECEFVSTVKNVTQHKVDMYRVNGFEETLCTLGSPHMDGSTPAFLEKAANTRPTLKKLLGLLTQEEC